ncbi:PepSY domain-containing protein [Hoeflea sp.]|uniref:PepSY domain-containing protein n=1 Tax=Hoeflea sp. TaxID=1940281 RepID=UPI003B01F1B5
MQKSALAALAALVSLAAEPAFATGLLSCESGDQSGWKPQSELEAKMVSEGWQVRRIKEDGGCYEAYGTTPDGERVEAYFHPVTLELLLVARRGQILFQKED